HSSSASSSSGNDTSVDSSGARIVKPVKLAALPNFDDSSDSSESEYGCGTYRRRESLSQSSSKESSSASSSSRSSDDDSRSSHSSSSNKKRTVKGPTPLAAKEASVSTATSADKKKVAKSKSSFDIIKQAVSSRFRRKPTDNKKVGDILVPNKLERFNPSTPSMGSRKSGGSSIPSRRESSSDDDSESDSSGSDESSSDESSVASGQGKKRAALQAAPASSAVAEPKNKIIRRRSSTGSDTSRNRHPSLSPTLYTAEQDKMMMRRRSSSGRNLDNDNSSSNRGGPGPAQATTRAQSSSRGVDRRRKDTKKSDIDNDFNNVLRQAKTMKEERRRRSSIEEQNVANSGVRTRDDDDARLEKMLKRMSSAGESGGRDLKGYGSDDDMFEAPKLVFERQSMKFLFEKSEGSSETDDGSSGRLHMNHSMEDSDDDSSSTGSEGSGVASLSTESSFDDDNTNTVRTMSSNEEYTNSVETQMSILTPISEERAFSSTGIDDTGANTKSDEDSSESSAKSISDSDLENEEDEPDHDRTEQRNLELHSPKNAIQSGVTRGEAMLADLPDENETTLSKRKAVLAIMRDSSLSAVDRNKKIQDVMAGRVELPILSSKVRADPPVIESQNVLHRHAEPAPTGGEAMLTDMPDENDVVLAKRKAVQIVMKDSSMGAVEKNKKIQDILAGRVELRTISPKPSEDPLHTPKESSNIHIESVVPKKVATVTSRDTQNGKNKDKPGRRKKRPPKQSKAANGDSNLQSTFGKNRVSEDSAPHDYTRKSPLAWSNDDVQASNRTEETLDSSECQYGDENIERNGSKTSFQEEPEANPYHLLEIDRGVSAAEANRKRQIFQDALSCAESSVDKTPAEKALLTAMTIALHDLDSQWNLDFFSASSKSPSRSSMTIQRTLGKNVVTDDASKKADSPPDRQHFLLDLASPNEQKSVNKPQKPSRGLTKATSVTWRCSILGADALRQTLFASSDLYLLRGALPHTSESPCSSDPENENNKVVKPTLSKYNMKLQRWASSFLHLDPRWQIRKFFDDASIFSGDSEIFTVWRPTSAEAIAKMMRGEGVGKGLEIKGKSATCGDLSGYVPFLQIHEDHHKTHTRIPKSDRTKIFFKSREARNAVGEHLGLTVKEMTLRLARAKFALAKRTNDENEAFLLDEISRNEVGHPKIELKDDYSPDLYGIVVSCRVLWEGLVVHNDISRESGSAYNTGRASQPAFQDMNFCALRKRDLGNAIPVLYQYSDDPFDPRMLIMAYEEEGRVVPVVSDFDCFLIGSRNFNFEDEMSGDQIELLEWCVSQIEWILDNQTGIPELWTTKWLEVLKFAAQNGFVPKMPPFGFGDPTSYTLIEAAVYRSKSTCGAVTHGPECFNFFFPQDIDPELLVIFPGNKKWRYVTQGELQSILIQKIKEGFTMPLNPKWILCDPGWIEVFVELLKSQHPGVRNSMNMWFPPKSGLRERIIGINKKHPGGFISDDKNKFSVSIAVQEYERFLVLQRAKQKCRGFLYWRAMLNDFREKAASEPKEKLIADLSNLRTVVSTKSLANALKNGSVTDIENDVIDAIGRADFLCREGEEAL
ncbi:hypothetical protein ACHAW6_011860, partial [Cyclotella cf. meneghiniana]